jgi:hypothetical protein
MHCASDAYLSLKGFFYFFERPFYYSSLTCQRCLDEVKLHLEPKFQLAFVQNEQQGEELGSSFEMILSTEDEFSTRIQD